MHYKKYSFILLVLSCFMTWTSLSYTAEMKVMDLIHIQGCKGCHSLDGKGGTLGPELDGVGSRLTWEQLKQRLVNPKKQKPPSAMPDYRHLSTSELQLLTDYLTQLR
jgi:mono/diheme cytochrome c family protein